LANVPWLDIQSYGATPLTGPYSAESTTCDTNGTVNVTLNPSGGPKHFYNGGGVCIWAAGGPTTQSYTPVAPTAAVQGVVGTKTIKYVVVGVDAQGGLTPASPVGQVTNAPTIFGNPAVTINTISASSGTVTVVLNSPLGSTVTAGMTIHIVGVTGAGSGWNGVWTIASVTSSTQITFALAGASGTGTVSASSTGRISNVQPITAISRNSSGVITITTAKPHNFQATPTSHNPAVVIVEGVAPSDLVGEFVILTASGNTITCQSPTLNAPETGTVTGGSSTATCYEYIYVTCPSYITYANTAAWYLYSDSENPGGTLKLIGKTMPLEMGWKDYGPSYGAGFVAPGYVPTTPSASAQNQLFATTITSGGGTTSLVLAQPVPATIGSYGATIVHDDGQALAAAITAATYPTSTNAVIALTPPASPNVTFPQYIINFPISIPSGVTILQACALQCNETLTYLQGGAHLVPFEGANPKTLGQGIATYQQVFGTASPLVRASTGGSGFGFRFEGVYVSVGGASGNINNGQYGVIIECSSTLIRNCFFSGGNSGTAVPLIYNSTLRVCSWHAVYDSTFQAASVYGDTMVSGQSCMGPAVPSVLLHTGDYGPVNAGKVGDLIMTGNIQFNGRGVLLDDYNSGGGEAANYRFGPTVEDQAATTPGFMVWGQSFLDIYVFNWTNDSSQQAVLAAWIMPNNGGSYVDNVQLESCSSALVQLVTGQPALQLASTGNWSGYPGVSRLGQNYNLVAKVAVGSLTTSASTSDTVTIYGATPYSYVSLTPTNSAAAADLASGRVYVSAKGTNAVTIAHSATAGETFDILATAD